MNVPMADLPSQHRDLRSELTEAFEETMDACDFGGLGASTSAFERETADFCGARHGARRQLRHGRPAAVPAGDGRRTRR